MNPSILILCLAAVLSLSGITAWAQDKASPGAATADAPAQTEMQKWIATTDAQWQAAFNREVTDIHAAEIKKLAAQYGAALDAAIAKASSAGDLDGAVALRNEKKRYADTNVFPEQDEEADAASVKQVRAVIRSQLAKMEKDHALRARALHSKYDQVLAQAQTQLTQHQRLDDALLVKAKRDEVAAAWLTPDIKAVLAKAEAASPKPPEVPAKPLAAVQNPKAPMTSAATATMERNLFTNSNFENGLEGWEVTPWAKNGTVAIDTKELHNGKPTLRIDNAKGDFTFVKQVVGKPHTRYRLTGFIKTLNVVPVSKGGKDGAVLAVGFTADVKGGKSVPIQKTQTWTKVSVDFGTTDKTEIRIGAGLGFYNSCVTGTAWFSDLSLIEVGQNAEGKRKK